MVKKYSVTYDAKAAYSQDGPIHASYEPYQFPKQKVQREHADGQAYDLIWVPNSINFATQRRSSAKTEHLEAPGAAGSRSNFHLLPSHRVTQVLMQERHKGDERTWKATGVKITARGATPKTDCYPTNFWNITATREVVVSAGTLHTPQVLERSGIGAKDILYAAGVPVRVNLPGVGWNLQDHMNFNMQWKYNKRVFPMPEDLQKNATFAAEALAEWNANKSGPYTVRYNNGAFLSLAVVTEKADAIVAEILGQDVEPILPLHLDPTLVAGVKEMYKVIAKQYASGESAVVEIPLGTADVNRIVSLKVLSRGSIHIGPRDDGFTQGDEEPILDYLTFSNPIDKGVVIEIIKRSIAGASVKTDKEIGDWFLDNISPGRAHPVGTARIGPRELGGVLRPDLTVYDTYGLSVADNSVIPIIASAHTATSAYAIGEKAADLR